MEKQQPQIKNPIKKKQSHKKPLTQNGNGNGNGNVPTSTPVKNIKKSISHKQKNSGVSFNIKNNVVEKFYCPQIALSKLTKTCPIDLNAIPDLPEIPLGSLIDNQ